MVKQSRCFKVSQVNEMWNVLSPFSVEHHKHSQDFHRFQLLFLPFTVNISRWLGTEELLLFFHNENIFTCFQETLLKLPLWMEVKPLKCSRKILARRQ